MVARGQLFDYGRRARRIERGEQDGRFHLGGVHGQGIADGQHLRRTVDDERQPAAAARVDMRPHALQRLDHALHRAVAQAGVASEEGEEGVGGEQPHHQPRAGAGIAHVEHVGSLVQAAQSHSLHMPVARLPLLYGDAEQHERAHRVQHVLAFEQTLDIRGSKHL